ncbi:hypothetical protein SPONN_1980 [uncultured Candidatus Thioglobus sp.]|nr:hypothetical protein SPONN_1980 [uncultured Candidatus Thioglobus sp.]
MPRVSFYKKIFLPVSFLVFTLLSANVSAATDEQAQLWYQMGYDYSQKRLNDEAFKWTIRAAEAGHIVAQNNIGLSYLHGLGVKKDKNAAFKWFEKSAKQGLSYAQSELAMLYYRQGNTAQAQKWWQIAADSNDEYAQFNLASLFLEQNKLEKALYWFEKARENRHPDASIALKKMSEARLPTYKTKEKYEK